MLQRGVQTENIVNDEHPEEGFAMLARAGFSCADFSLNGYLKNTDIYRSRLNRFFDQSVAELERFFAPHKQGAQEYGGLRFFGMSVYRSTWNEAGKISGF